MANIYGVDTEQPITAQQVRDAIVACFVQAHHDVAYEAVRPMVKDFGEEGVQRITKGNIEGIVRRAFRETGGDFDHPDKQALIKVMDWLADFSNKYREPEIITKHYSEVMELVKKLE